MNALWFTMPITDGVATSSTVWWRRRRPSPRMLSRCICSWPCVLFSIVTLIFLPEAARFVFIGSTQDFFDRLAALGGDLGRHVDAGQAVEGGAHHVDRVARAEALGQHVLHAGHFEHRAHGAAGDDAGAVRGRAREHA